MPTEPGQLIYRPYTEGDEEAILELHGSTFQTPRSRESWRWKFLENPHGGYTAHLALEAATGVLAGYYTVVPVMLSFRGQPVPACVSTDIMVHPGFRRRGVFVETARQCHDRLAATGTRAVLVVPKQAAVPGLVGHLGFHRITTLHKWWYVTGPSRQRLLGSRALRHLACELYRVGLGVRLARLERRCRRELDRPVSFTCSREVPADADDLWQRVKDLAALSLWKDATYLRWRYEQHPELTFDVWAGRAGQQLVALAVVLTSLPAELTICELLVEGKNAPLGRLLVAHLLRHYLHHPRTNLSFVGRDDGFFADVFADFQLRRATGVEYCGRALEDPELEAHLPDGSSWTLTLGDTDSF